MNDQQMPADATGEEVTDVELGDEELESSSGGRELRQAPDLTQSRVWQTTSPFRVDFHT
jgi:hypothetical protein